MRSLLAILVLGAGCGPPPGPPTDGGLTVGAGDADSDAQSLSAAIAAAADGDTITVCTGIYTEQLTISAKKLKLVSGDGAATTPSFDGMFDSTGRDGNLSTQPQYIDAAAADFHLKPGSADMGSFGGPS